MFLVATRPWSVRWLCLSVGFYLLLSGRGTVAWGQFDASEHIELSGVVQLDEADNKAHSHLARTDAYVADQQWDDAVETLRQVMEDYGERVAPLAEGRYVSIRDLCHAKIASLPPEGLELYRLRVDALAKRWFDEGVRDRNETLLRRIVEELFCSSWGDDALLALGDLAIERGAHGAARSYWQRINPMLMTPEGGPWWWALQNLDPKADWQQIEPMFTGRPDSLGWLAYPDTEIALPDVRARLVLASILAENRERAKAELGLFRQLHPDVRGHLGGRQVDYAQELAALLAVSDHWPRLAVESDWKTFAGSPQRSRVLPSAQRIVGPAWDSHVPLSPPAPNEPPENDSTKFDDRQMNRRETQPLRFHPLVVGDLLLWNDQKNIYARNLHTGKPAWGGDEGIIFRPSKIIPTSASPPHSRPRLGTARFTMTAHKGKLYVRMGDPVTSRATDSVAGSPLNYLVCLDLSKQGSKVWEITPEDERWAFEGSPICDGANIYVGMRLSGVRPQAHVGCFDAETGRRRWRRFVSAADTPAPGQADQITHNLITLADDTIYYNTNLGTVAALSARDGSVRWIHLYRRTIGSSPAQRGVSLDRDLNPCITHQGVVLVAPSDSEHVFALDATTGAMLWTIKLPDDDLRLLGAAGGNLIASGDRLWWIELASGKIVRRWPEGPHSGTRAWGRGVLVGGEVYWPSADRIRIFDTQTGRQTQEAIRLDVRGATGGNLLVTSGYLLIASHDVLYGFSEQARAERPTVPEITQRLNHGLLAERLSH